MTRLLSQATCLLGGLLLTSPPLHAATHAATSQPDRLDFGSVPIHATVEGSILLLTDADQNAQLSCDVQPPPFLKVTRVQRGIATDGTRGTKTTFYIYVAVVTDHIGEYEGSITVGSLKSTIPVKVHVLPPDPSTTRVLIVRTPFHCSSTGDASAFHPWLRLVQSAKLAPDYLEVRPNQPLFHLLDLSKYNVILLAEDGLVRLQDPDITKLDHFVNDGGRLVVCANHFFRGTVDMANRLLVPAGLQFTDTETFATKDPFTLSGNDIIHDPLTKNVRTVKCFRPSPVAVTHNSKAKILINASNYPGAGYLAAGQHGKGQVIAVGQSLWWHWIGDTRFKDCDNPQLLLNLLTRNTQ